jgi:CubicO group peptidase (beta-lactamase class C family)
MYKSLSIFFISIFVITTSFGQTKQEKSLSQKLDDYLISVSQANRFNGTALIAQKGKILLQKSYGWKNYETKTTNDTNCIFQIASVTKTFTSAIILKLQESGKLSVKDKVDKYLPDFPNGKKISIENLLTHTSGIGNIDIEETDTITWTPMHRAEILNAFQNEPLSFKPGTDFTYRNSGYFLLGLMIEKVTGMTYQKAVRKMIFEPLQMTHSGFDFINLNDTLKATGYTILTQKKQTIAHLIDSTVTFAYGDIYSTASDLYKWAKAIARKQVLAKDSWKQTFTPFPLNAKYGYGWFTGSINNKKCVWHGGALFGFASNLTYFPNEDVTIILLNNVLNESNQQVLPVNSLSAIVFNKPYTLYKEKSEVKISDEDLEKFTGTYSLSTKPSSTMIVTKKDGNLMLMADKNTTLQFVFNTEKIFEFKNLPPGEITGEFIIEKGKVKKMIFSQRGLFEWIKIK